jgi:hypothetical protein
MQAIAILLLCIAACTHGGRGAERDAATAALLEQPVLSALAIRICSLKSEIHGNAPGWEAKWRIAELANDALGLPPFAQDALPGPTWHPVPTSLLGMGRFARARADELARDHEHAELAFLVRDERSRYARGLIEVHAYVSDVEQWARTTSSAPVGRALSSCGTSTFRSRLAAGM